MGRARALWAVTAVIAVGLASPMVGATAAPHYFPVKVLPPRLRQVPVPRGEWRRLGNLPVNTQVQAVSRSAILLSTFPSAANGWRQRLSAVDPGTGAVTTLIHLPFGQEAPVSASDNHWLVYEDAAFKNGSYRTVVAENLKTHHLTVLLHLSLGTYSAGPISGMMVSGAHAYWLSTLVVPNAGLVSQVYAADLATGRIQVLMRLSARSTHTILLAMAPGSGGLWLSADRTGGTSGLWFWSLSRKRVTRKIAVPQAPELLYGANPFSVLFSANYSDAPSSSKGNASPYPLYALNFSEQKAVQVTSAVQPGEHASVDGSWVAVSGLGLQSALINLSARREMLFQAPQAELGGGWVVLRTSGGIRWRSLGGMS